METDKLTQENALLRTQVAEQQVYNGPLCRQCHRDALWRTLSISIKLMTVFVAEILLLLGLGKGSPHLNVYVATLKWLFRESANAIASGFLRLTKAPPARLLILTAILSAITAAPSCLVWIGWQWKLARYGQPSKLRRLYRVSEIVWQFFVEIWAAYKKRRSAGNGRVTLP